MRAIVAGFMLVVIGITSCYAEDAPSGIPPAPGYAPEAAREQEIEDKRQAQAEAKREAQAKARLDAAAARRSAQQAQHVAEPPRDAWASAVRALVASTLAPVLGSSRRAQRFGVAFKVSETGDVFNVKIDGEPRLARRGEAKLLATHMPAPPDQHDHSITVGINVHDYRGPTLGPLAEAKRTPKEESDKDRWIRKMAPTIMAATIGDSLPPGIPSGAKIEVGFRVDQQGRPSIVVIKGEAALAPFAKRTLAKTVFGPLPNGIESGHGFTWVYVTPNSGNASKKPASGMQQGAPSMLKALGGSPEFGAAMYEARPQAATAGRVEGQRWKNQVYAMLEAKLEQLPRPEHYKSGGKVAICFHVDPDGHVLLQEFCEKSGYADVDTIAMRALHAAAPFPPPPPNFDPALVWVKIFDGKPPVLGLK